jgi:hypothetical protein
MRDSPWFDLAEARIHFLHLLISRASDIPGTGVAFFDPQRASAILRVISLRSAGLTFF